MFKLWDFSILHSNLLTTFPKDAFVFKVCRAAFIMVMVYMLINAISSKMMGVTVAVLTMKHDIMVYILVIFSAYLSTLPHSRSCFSLFVSVIWTFVLQSISSQCVSL